MKNNKSIRADRIARWISEVSNAPIIAIPVFTAINYYLVPEQWLFYTIVSLFFISASPVIIGLLWAKKKNIEADMPVKEDRIYPLLMVISLYFVGLITLYVSGAPLFTTALIFCYLSNTIIVFFINLKWKISIHAMGVAGPAAAMIYLFGYGGVLLASLLPAVMWSRVYLKRHTVSQVLCGSLLGLFWTYAQISILLNL